MGAVCRREGIVDPEVAELGELRDERRVVLLFALVEAGVLQKQNVAGLHRRDRGRGLVANAILGKCDGPLRRKRYGGGDGLERLLRVGPLRAAEVGEQNHLAALVRYLGGGRHVEIDAEQHPFALHIGLIEGAKVRHADNSPTRCVASRRDQNSFPIATAVSAMRLEKPHSLSYQDITRTKVPSMTLVWSMWKIELCGSWLKSQDTFGSLV